MKELDAGRPFVEKMKRVFHKATTLGAVSLVAACAAPQQAEQTAETTTEVVDSSVCRFNGDPGDKDPSRLNKGEAAIVFAGTWERLDSKGNPGITIVRPIVKLGEAGVMALFDTTYEPHNQGFRINEYSRAPSSGTWKVDTVKVDPASPQKMRQFDGCRPDIEDLTGADKLPVSFVTLEGVVETPMDQTPGGMAVDVPTYTIATELPLPDGRGPRPRLMAVDEWWNNGVFATAVGTNQGKAAGIGANMSEIDVPTTR